MGYRNSRAVKEKPNQIVEINRPDDTPIVLFPLDLRPRAAGTLHRGSNEFARSSSRPESGIGLA
jgi:hypothetical protein